MNGLFIFAIVLGILALTALLIGIPVRAAGKRDDDDDMLFGGIAAIVIGIILLGGAGLSTLAASYNSVGTYDEGVVTSFGRVTGYAGPGIHWVAPWNRMALMDESVQSLDYTTTVRLAQQQTAKATVHLRFNIRPSATDQLFRQYKGSTKNATSGLVEPKLNEAMNTVLGGYNPITPLSTHAKEGTADNPTTAQLSQQIEAQLNAMVGTQVNTVSLVLKPLDYDSEVDHRINSVISQTAKTDTAAEAIKTAQNQAAANKALQANLTPLALVQQCMTAIADGQLKPPAGFSCWPGQGSGVVIPSGK